MTKPLSLPIDAPLLDMIRVMGGARRHCVRAGGVANEASEYLSVEAQSLPPLLLCVGAARDALRCAIKDLKAALQALERAEQNLREIPNANT